MPKEFQSPFRDYVAPLPSPAGDWAKTAGGADIPDGQKETPGEIGTSPTYADVEGAPTPGSSLTGEVTAVANSKERGLPGAK